MMHAIGYLDPTWTAIIKSPLPFRSTTPAICAGRTQPHRSPDGRDGEIVSTPPGAAIRAVLRRAGGVREGGGPVEHLGGHPVAQRPAWPANSFPLSAVTVWTGGGGSDGDGIASIAAETAAEVRRSTLREYVYSGARSTSGTTAPLCPFPMIVSASRSPTRSLLSTSAGLPEMSTRPGMWPRPECLPPPGSVFPRRRSSGNSPPPAFLSASDTRMSTAGPPPSRPPDAGVPRAGPLRTKGGKNGRIPGWSGSGLLDAIDRGDADIEVARQLPD